MTVIILTQTANDNLIHLNGIINFFMTCLCVAIVCLLGIIFKLLLIEVYKHIISSIFATSKHTRNVLLSNIIDRKNKENYSKT